MKSSSLFLFFLLVLSPSLVLARDLPKDCICAPDLPSPSQAPRSHLEPEYPIEQPSSSPSQAPQGPPHTSKPPSPSQAPEAPLEPEYPIEPPSPSQAPQPHLEPEYPIEPPSSSPSQAPLAPPHTSEPPSPSQPPEAPEYPIEPPSPSHAPLGPQVPKHESPSPLPSSPSLEPPVRGTTPLSQCWAPVFDVTGCVDNIRMAYLGVNLNVAPKCCNAINKTSDECLFDMLYYRTFNKFFILWLREHCSH